MSKMRVCFSGSLQCSGVEPCPQCSHIVGMYVLPTAMVRAGFNGSPEQAQAFLAGYQEGWRRLFAAFTSDVELARAAHARIVDLDQLIPPTPAPPPQMPQGFPSFGVPPQGFSPQPGFPQESLQQASPQGYPPSFPQTYPQASSYSQVVSQGSHPQHPYPQQAAYPQQAPQPPLPAIPPNVPIVGIYPIGSAASPAPPPGPIVHQPTVQTHAVIEVTPEPPPLPPPPVGGGAPTSGEAIRAELESRRELEERQRMQSLTNDSSPLSADDILAASSPAEASPMVLGSVMADGFVPRHLRGTDANGAVKGDGES